MIKLTFCLRRLPHLTREEFQRYWREQHAPLVARHAGTLGILRYVQTHTGHDALNSAMQGSRGGPDAYDGVAELWLQYEVRTDDITMIAIYLEEMSRMDEAHEQVRLGLQKKADDTGASWAERRQSLRDLRRKSSALDASKAQTKLQSGTPDVYKPVRRVMSLTRPAPIPMLTPPLDFGPDCWLAY